MKKHATQKKDPLKWFDLEKANSWYFLASLWPCKSDRIFADSSRITATHVLCSFPSQKY